MEEALTIPGPIDVDGIYPHLFAIKQWAECEVDTLDAKVELTQADVLQVFAFAHHYLLREHYIGASRTHAWQMANGLRMHTMSVSRLVKALGRVIAQLPDGDKRKPGWQEFHTRLEGDTVLLFDQLAAVYKALEAGDPWVVSALRYQREHAFDFEVLQTLHAVLEQVRRQSVVAADLSLDAVVCELRPTQAHAAARMVGMMAEREDCMAKFNGLTFAVRETVTQLVEGLTVAIARLQPIVNGQRDEVRQRKWQAMLDRVRSAREAYALAVQNHIPNIEYTAPDRHTLGDGTDVTAIGQTL